MDFFGIDDKFLESKTERGSGTANVFKKTSKKDRNGFEQFDLDHRLLKAIRHKGYNQPSPIQRKAIPKIIKGHDLVGMARTGSGKTAAFVIPIIQRLHAHSAETGIRALILSPNRELAIQTLKLVKELSKGTDLRSALVVGGESLEEQFSTITANPDIVIATPGRFLHVQVEMSLSLKNLALVVFDEADRLFEMGFSTQLNEILHKLPDDRVTCLFSATLPQSLIEFARAGLKEPLLVRLDSDSKLSPDLQCAFFKVQTQNLIPALFFILSKVIKLRFASDVKGAAANKIEDTTAIFVPTKHQVEFLAQLLSAAGYEVSYIYGSLNQVSRNYQLQRFRKGESNLLIVTDIAARGIDIPFLSNVINFNFPCQPKTFIHRVGRTARAGRSGWAYSLLTPSDFGYLLDLQIFLGKELHKDASAPKNYTDKIIVGELPESEVGLSAELFAGLMDNNVDLNNLAEVGERAMKLYNRTKPKCSAASAIRAKQVLQEKVVNTVHPLFPSSKDSKNQEAARSNLLDKLHNYQASQSIFELGQRGSKATFASTVAKDIRSKFCKRKHTTDSNSLDVNDGSKDGKDEFYIAHPSTEKLQIEQNYNVNNQDSTRLDNLVSSVSFDLLNDETNIASGPKQSSGQSLKWDKKRKNFVRVGDPAGAVKMIKGEDGRKIAASFKSGKYEEWLAGKSKLPKSSNNVTQNYNSGHVFQHKKIKAPKMPDKARDNYIQQKKRYEAAKESGLIRPKVKSELKTSSDIRKQRALSSKRKAKNARPSRQKKGKF